MTDQRHGKVVTFYSFKGGAGRTMALANVAWILAANGKRVLVADWDLESPGLHRFFEPFLGVEKAEATAGIIDMIRSYEYESTRPFPREDGWYKAFAQVNAFAFTLDWGHFPPGGRLSLLSAGRQNREYSALLNAINWDDFYHEHNGGAFIDALAADMRANYDYALLDSRSGLSDVADICSVQLPDVLVDCFALNAQSIDGAAKIAEVVTRRPVGVRPPIRVLPVPMRVDPAEKEKAEAGRTFARRRFPGMPAGLTASERAGYWNAVEVPYQPFYAYEETLATFADRPGQSATLLAAYEKLTRFITDGDVVALPHMDETLRIRTAKRFVRSLFEVSDEVTLRYAAEDQAWAEWIGGVLKAVGVSVHDPNGPTGAPPTAAARSLTLISHANAAAFAGIITRDRSALRPSLAIYVDDVTPLPSFAPSSSAFLAGQPAEVAVERTLRLVGLWPGEKPDLSAIGTRFPGERPVVINAPSRNGRFTGRKEFLLGLRAGLRGGVGMPVVLQGMGGTGKTQLALEYAHRFRNAYDVVWWVDADMTTFVDTQVAELGQELGLNTAGSGVEDKVRKVIGALEDGEPYARWLLIFDNAEDVDELLEFVPRQSGHVLVTSRNNRWGDRALPMPVDVFQRPESVEHLRRRLPMIGADEADRLADLLGDLPLAVADAGAWLSETGEPVGEFLRRVELTGPGEAVEQVWTASLDLLRERSAAAYRLLELCSMLAPEIPLELVYGHDLATALVDLDPFASDRHYRAALIQHLHRLALVKLDVSRRRIQVHRLLQHVVRGRMTETDRDDTRHRIHRVLADSRPPHEIDDPASWSRFDMLWPHLEMSGAADCADETVRQLMIDRLRHLWITGRFDEGLRFGRRMEQKWATAWAADGDTLHRQLLHLRFNIANLLRQTAQFEQALVLDEAVLREQVEVLGREHPHTLMTAGGLGGDLRASGRYADALRHDEKTYLAWVEHYGESFPRTLLALNNLATTNRLAGDFRTALERDQHTYEQWTILVGQGHPYTLNAGSNLGRDLRDAGEYARSVELLDDIARRYQSVLGSRSHLTLGARVNLAVSLGCVGRHAEAAELLDETYEQLLEALGPFNPVTLACRSGLAVSHFALGEAATCLSEFEEIRLARATELGRRHPHTLVAGNNLAVAQQAIGERGPAGNLAAEIVDEMRTVLGDSHPHTLACELNLAILRGGPQRPALVESLVDRHRMVLGPDHPDTLRCMAAAGRDSGDLFRMLDAHPF
ncbi:FxSxx-COOH system tetratricopeptide repeat protein [Actinoplanes solisilvae]|uniref:FxSxx-COOH system tetratricopeptide repeat protein n=1 Tax=Actinoplanes solisilvae TaxID=2486853 RepID=UPI000FDA38FE|nr:FxSxx-COOH system tetratricopeptide repeat protein [Actinoplanes solisilvae]